MANGCGVGVGVGTGVDVGFLSGVRNVPAARARAVAALFANLLACAVAALFAHSLSFARRSTVGKAVGVAVAVTFIHVFVSAS